MVEGFVPTVRETMRRRCAFISLRESVEESIAKQHLFQLLSDDTGKRRSEPRSRKRRLSHTGREQVDVVEAEEQTTAQCRTLEQMVESSIHYV